MKVKTINIMKRNIISPRVRRRRRRTRRLPQAGWAQGRHCSGRQGQPRGRPTEGARPRRAFHRPPSAAATPSRRT